MARHRHGDEEGQAEEQVCPREDGAGQAWKATPPSIQLQLIQRESRRQDDDDHTHDPESTKASACEKVRKQGRSEGVCYISPGDREGLSEQHASIRQQQQQQRGERKTPLKALSYLLV